MNRKGKFIRKRYPHKSENRFLGKTFNYLLTNFPFFWVNKFGISDTTKKRVKNVDETTPGSVTAILSAELLYGYQCEQFVHSLYFFQNWHTLLKVVGLSDLWQGSGRTEWFLNFSPIVGFCVWYLNSRFDLGLVTEDFVYWKYERLGLFFFTPFVWLDGVFWILFFRIFRLALSLAVVFFILYFVANSK